MEKTNPKILVNILINIHTPLLCLYLSIVTPVVSFIRYGWGFLFSVRTLISRVFNFVFVSLRGRFLAEAIYFEWIASLARQTRMPLACQEQEPGQAGRAQKVLAMTKDYKSLSFPTVFFQIEQFGHYTWRNNE